ncbi:hypothetical protein C8F04DRAFT_1176807 [Mycena alexandri]|uniref:3'-5' exonuclease domain-containing protein n=1 Tax=Mycena alexandri TaxID=1745969 RepID=A0AAD6T910_9AGAR|nr:hypothetical protein C8F04DRAFT_1176807 [Mycena alexandri]
MQVEGGSSEGSKSECEEPTLGFRIVIPDDKDKEILLAANEILTGIEKGVVGFDTEFTKRIPSSTDQIILDMEAPSPTAKKAAKAILQYLELVSEKGYQTDWEKAGLCTIQIATALPVELKRILESPEILLAGAGLLSDTTVIWEDLHIDMKQLTDVGLMTRLWKPEARDEEGFQHLALDSATKDVLQITIDKSKQSLIDWRKEPSESDITCKRETNYHTDAAIDTAVSLRLFEFLSPALVKKEQAMGKQIPASWYTYNMTEGEPTRINRSHKGAVIPWSFRDCTWWMANKFKGYLP